MINDKETKRIIEEESEGPTLDYKEDLVLVKEGDKAGFVKDVISLANSGGVAHIIAGIEDGTRKLVGLNSSYQVEQLNQILMDKSDPPLRIEYEEKNVMGHKVGVIEIDGSNAPYIVAVHDKYGGSISDDPKKSLKIERGTVFVRNFNMNEGARRADLDKMYERMKPIILESDLHLSTEVSTQDMDELVRVEIEFILNNDGDAIATDSVVFMKLRNVKEIVKCTGLWNDVTEMNEGLPSIDLSVTKAVIKNIIMKTKGVIVNVEKETNNIEAEITMGASNMRTRHGKYIIPVISGSRSVVF